MLKQITTISFLKKGGNPIINRPTRISEHSAILTDKFLTTDIFSNSLKKVINRMFLIIFQCFSIQLAEEKLREGVIKTVLLISVTSFMEELPLLHWRHNDFNGSGNKIFVKFQRTMIDICDVNLPIREYWEHS